MLESYCMYWPTAPHTSRQHTPHINVILPSDSRTIILHRHAAVPHRVTGPASITVRPGARVPGVHAEPYIEIPELNRAVGFHSVNQVKMTASKFVVMWLIVDRRAVWYLYINLCERPIRRALDTFPTQTSQWHSLHAVSEWSTMSCLRSHRCLLPSRVRFSSLNWKCTFTHILTEYIHRPTVLFSAGL